MAQKVEILLVDDVDGTEASETLTFGLDGYTYEIDLNSKNATKLRKSMESYVGVARRVGKPSRPKSDGKAIREWARSAGIDVPDRGAIPRHVREAYAAR